jgi:hypothetical protein
MQFHSSLIIYSLYSLFVVLLADLLLYQFTAVYACSCNNA